MNHHEQQKDVGVKVRGFVWFVVKFFIFKENYLQKGIEGL